MSSRREFALILVSVIALTAAASHGLVAWLGIETRPSVVKKISHVGATYNAPPILLAGGSIIGAGVDWALISSNLSRQVEGATVPSASPCELEILARQAPDAGLTIIATSPYELDDQFISEYRAHIVPLAQTVRDLMDSHVDRQFVEDTLTRYPLSYAQLLFPTAGRSLGVMVGIRSKLRARGFTGGMPGVEAPLVMNAVVTNTVADWTQDRLMRNIAQMQSECHDHHDFFGPKHLALVRFIHQALGQGKVVIAVMPVSPVYVKYMFSRDEMQQFDRSLEDVQKKAPGAIWLRFDKIPALHDAAVYSDLVHMNHAGRMITTSFLDARLRSLLHAP